jgi:hypothetical protein
MPIFVDIIISLAIITSNYFLIKVINKVTLKILLFAKKKARGIKIKTKNLLKDEVAFRIFAFVIRTFR